MKEIHFSEEELKDLRAIGEKLFYSEDDPTAPSYKRILIRPELNYISILLHLVLPLIILSAYAVVLNIYGLLSYGSIMAGISALMLYIVLSLKKAALCCIKIYQHYAPDRIRNKCRFEPSCSQYMLLAIEKYGLIKGINKGIKRLKRCNINHGGYDFP